MAGEEYDPERIARSRAVHGCITLSVMHVVVATLILIERAVPALPPVAVGDTTIAPVVYLAGGPWMAAASIAAGVSVFIASLRLSAMWNVVACSLSGAVMLWWGILLIIWAQSSRPPESLTSGVLSLICAAGAFILASSWSVRDVDG